MAKSRVRRSVNRLPAERRVQDIMIAARSVFTAKGYDEALISEIAEKAGVVEGSIYRYFVNKRDLLRRVVEHWYEELLARDDEQFAAVRGACNQIRFIVRCHLMTIRREPALSRLMFQEFRPEAGYRQTRLFQLNQSYSHRVVEVVKAGVGRGELRADVAPALVRDMIYGCIEHRTWAFLRNEGTFEIDETADAIANVIYRGLRVHEPEPDRLALAVERLEKVADRLEPRSAP